MTIAVRTVALLLSSGSLVSLAGCALPPRAASRAPFPDARTQLSKEELGELLQQFEDTYEATIREAAERIVTLQPDRRTRHLALLWQMRLIPMARDTLNQDDAVYSLLDGWALCVRQRDFFERGDGRELFGANQALAQEAARRSLGDIERIAALILTPESLNRTRPAIEDLALQFPLRGEFSGSVVRTAVQKPARNADVLASVLRAPLAPFRAMEGIDRGAAAIQGFTAVAAHLTDTVNDLPETIRLQTNLLLMDIDELESVQTAQASLAELAHSSARLSTVAECLPADLRRELSLAAEDLEQRQASFQETLRETREVIACTNEALARVQTAAASVEQTATHATAAGDAWAGTVRAITEMVASFRPPDDQPAAESSPADRIRSGNDYPPVVAHGGPAPSPGTEQPRFDVNDYTQAADALDRAALQIRELTREIRQLAGSSELATSLTQTETRARGIVELSHTSALAAIDHLAWRGAQLIGLLFAALLGYTALTRFLGARVRPPTSDRA